MPKLPIGYVEAISPLMTHRVMIQDRIEGLCTPPRLFKEYSSEEEAKTDLDRMIKVRGLFER